MFVSMPAAAWMTGGKASRTRPAKASDPPASDTAGSVGSALALALTLAISAPGALAQRYDDSSIDDRLTLRLGTFSVRDYSTRVRIDSSDGVLGTVLDFEDLLAVDGKADVGRLDGHYRFDRRHRVDFSYFAIDRSGRATLTVPKGHYRLFVSGRRYAPFRLDGPVTDHVRIRAELRPDVELSDADIWS